MNSMVRSIPFSDFTGASIAALERFDIFVGCHPKTLLFRHVLYEEARLQHSSIPILNTTQNYRFTSQVYSTFPRLVHLSPDFVLPISLN